MSSISQNGCFQIIGFEYSHNKQKHRNYEQINYYKQNENRNIKEYQHKSNLKTSFNIVEDRF